jgi:hypothetical protein
MFPGSPGSDQIIGNSLTANGTLATVPAGTTLTANIALNAAVAVLGTANLTVTVNGVDAAPVAGSVVARLTVSGLLAAAACGAQEFEIVCKAPPGNPITLAFAISGAGTGSACINGWFFS